MPNRKLPILRSALAGAVVLALLGTVTYTKFGHNKQVVTPISIQVVKPPEPAPVVVPAPAPSPVPKTKAPAAKPRPAVKQVQPRKA